MKILKVVTACMLFSITAFAETSMTNAITGEEIAQNLEDSSAETVEWKKLDSVCLSNSKYSQADAKKRCQQFERVLSIIATDNILFKTNCRAQDYSRDKCSYGNGYILEVKLLAL